MPDHLVNYLRRIQAPGLGLPMEGLVQEYVASHPVPTPTRLTIDTGQGGHASRQPQ
jgi:hypothetical protein